MIWRVTLSFMVLSFAKMHQKQEMVTHHNDFLDFVINTPPRVVFLRLCAVFVKNETLKKYLQTFASFYFHILPCKTNRTHTD